MIKNFTPHDVNIVDEKGNTLRTYVPEGLARCKQATIWMAFVDDIPISSTVFGEVEGLPEEQEGIYYIVSRLVMQGVGKSRKDLLVPNEIVRDKEGKIIGCMSLSEN